MTALEKLLRAYKAPDEHVSLAAAIAPGSTPNPKVLDVTPDASPDSLPDDPRESDQEWQDLQTVFTQNSDAILTSVDLVQPFADMQAAATNQNESDLKIATYNLQAARQMKYTSADADRAVAAVVAATQKFINDGVDADDTPTPFMLSAPASGFTPGAPVGKDQ